MASQRRLKTQRKKEGIREETEDKEKNRRTKTNETEVRKLMAS